MSAVRAGTVGKGPPPAAPAVKCLNTATGCFEWAESLSPPHPRPASRGRQPGGMRSLQGGGWAKGAGSSRRSLAHPIGIFLLHAVTTHRNAVNREGPPGLPRRRNLARALRRFRMRPKYSTLERSAFEPSLSLRPLATVVRAGPGFFPSTGDYRCDSNCRRKRILWREGERDLEMSNVLIGLPESRLTDKSIHKKGIVSHIQLCFNLSAALAYSIYEAESII